MGRFPRVLIGFAAACLAAAYTKLMFAVTPAELSALPADQAADRLAWIADKGWQFAILFGLFALPFAIVALAIAEWRGLRSWTYYALVALGIALVGYIAQWQSETSNVAFTVVANYALTSFLTTGFMAGLFYWLFSGRHAGGPQLAYPEGIDTAKTDIVRDRPSITRTAVMDPPSVARTEVMRSHPAEKTQVLEKPASRTEVFGKPGDGGKSDKDAKDAKPETKGEETKGEEKKTDDKIRPSGSVPASAGPKK